MDHGTAHITELMVSAALTFAVLSLLMVLESVLPLHMDDPRRLWARRTILPALGLTTVLLHVHVGAGTEFVMLDQRGAVLAVATLFGGLPVGIATAAIEMAYRLYLGGAAMISGLAGIVMDLTLAAITLRHVLPNAHDKTVRYVVIGALGVAVGLSDSLRLLLIQPFATGMEVFLHDGLLVFASQLIATLVFGGMLNLQDSRIQALRALEQQAADLQRALQQTVTGLSAAMAARDPMTADHQQRTADLAVAIGEAMGFSATQQEQLRLAALLHDIGQIHIPTDILTRPRALNADEMAFVQTHCEKSHHILKAIDLFRPVAEIILQHHENLDGSGYPLGLSGDAILPAARILRVSDSMEAMLSHRPFRRAHTLEYAIAELQAGSGHQFDPAVVDTCIRLFREHNYIFPVA